MKMIPLLGQINPIAFTIFNIEIRWYALIIVLGGILGYILYMREGKRFKLDEDLLLDLLFWAVIAGFIGARLYYVIFNWDFYSAHPDQILNVRAGGMAIYGGLIGGALAIYFLCRRRGQSFIQILDIAVPGVMLAQSIGRWGNFINQEAFGTAVPRSFLEAFHFPDWFIEQMYVNGNYHHPTFFYESLWNLVGLILLLFLRERPKVFKRGNVLAFYMVWYGLGRAWIEGLRTDSLYLGPLRISQWVSIVLVFLGLAIFIFTHRIHPEIAYYNEGRGDLNEEESA